MASNVTWNKPATDELMRTYNALMEMGLDHNFALVLLDQMKNRVAEQYRAAGIGTVQGGRREQMLNELMAKEAGDVMKWAREMQFKALQAAGPVAASMERKPVSTPGSESFLSKLGSSLAGGLGPIIASYGKQGLEAVYDAIFGRNPPADTMYLGTPSQARDIALTEAIENNRADMDLTPSQRVSDWVRYEYDKDRKTNPETAQRNPNAAPKAQYVTTPDVSAESPNVAGGAISPFLYDNRDWNTPAETQQGWSGWYNPSDYTSYTPDYTSYDYGTQANWDEYGQYTPPQYDYGQQDTGWDTGAYNVPNWVTDYQATPNQMNLSTWL